MTVADRIGVMDKGQLVQVATPSELYEQPTSRWVAEFIGDVNLIEGRIVEAGADCVIECPVVGRVRAGAVAGVKPGDTVWVALRPEKVQLAQERPAAAENCVAGTVRNIAYLGDLSVYKVELEGGFVLQAAVANVTRMTERPVTWDDRVWLTFARDAGVVLTR